MNNKGQVDHEPIPCRFSVGTATAAHQVEGNNINNDNWLYEHVPGTIIVTENGIGTTDDTRRIAYVQRALQGVSNCLKDGIDVRGYTYWSVLDNYEWMQGYRPTFGLIAVDRATQQRTIKLSTQWLGSIARADGF